MNVVDNVSDPDFGNLIWDERADRLTGRLEFRAGESVAVAFYLSGNGDVVLHELLDFARGQLAHMRRGEARYRQRALQETLKEQGKRKSARKKPVSEADLIGSLRLQELIFDEEGGSALVYSCDPVSDTSAAVEINQHGKVTMVEV